MVVVHGLFAQSTLLYQGIIDHFVGIGNIVIFATYETNAQDLLASYNTEDQALTTAGGAIPRGDFTRVGIVGHSMGGGAVPYLAQRAAARGWGSEKFFLLMLEPWASGAVGTGPITLPAHTRTMTVVVDNDTFVDVRIGIEAFHAFTLPASQKKFVTVRSHTHEDGKLDASHLAPNSILSPDDAIKFYGIYRNGDALEACTFTGRSCDADLTFMGMWDDGTPVTPAIVSADPVDVGPRASSAIILGVDGECDAPLNPRRANCGPSSL